MEKSPYISKRFLLAILLTSPCLIQCKLDTSFIDPSLKAHFDGAIIQVGGVMLYQFPSKKTPRQPRRAVKTKKVAPPVQASMALAPTTKENYGSCKPLEDPGFLSGVKSAFVTINEITLTSGGGKQHQLKLKPKRVNLFHLAPEITKILSLSQEKIPYGSYTKITIKTKSGMLHKKRGGKWPLKIEKPIELQLSRNLELSKSVKINLNFCTDGNFFVERNRSSEPQFAFHPEINEIFNLSM